jgi:hypothetical protein
MRQARLGPKATQATNGRRVAAPVADTEEAFPVLPIAPIPFTTVSSSLKVQIYTATDHYTNKSTRRQTVPIALVHSGGRGGPDWSHSVGVKSGLLTSGSPGPQYELETAPCALSPAALRARPRTGAVLT